MRESETLSIVPAADAALTALEPVAERARAYASASRSPSTRAAYERAWRAWEAWCSSHGLVTLPCRPESVALYLAARADRGDAVASMALALSAVSVIHVRAGHPSPRLAPVVAEVWAGIRRARGTAQRQAAPLGPEQLRRMVATGPGLGGVRDRALLLLGFAGAFRRSELVGLDVADLEWSEDGLVVLLRRSKTDQLGEGERVGVPFGSDRVTCPVRAMRDWLDVSGVATGAIFRGVRKGGRLSDHRLTGRDVARIVQRAACRAGVDVERLSGHSLRAGLATTAARAGKRADAIMRQGRWRSLATVTRYIRSATVLDGDNAAGGIGL